MAKNSNLGNAKKAKQDEFYTQWADIEKEMNAYLDYDPDVFRGKTILLPCDDPEWSNFTKYFALRFQDFGIKKLISTSYAPRSNMDGAFYSPQPTLFDDPNFDESKDFERGKLFILDGTDVNNDGRVNIEDFEWTYLNGDGDFRSEEVTKLRDEADMVITNPPFSLFRDFLAWLVEGDLEFSIIGNMNAVTYKDVFPLFRDNKIWYGQSIHSGDREFRVPDSYPLDAAGYRTDDEGNNYIRVKGVRWFTNIQHGRRHEPLPLMTMEDNKRYNKKIIKNEKSYETYDNYDAIEIPVTDGIPSDFEGVMGVPISFLDKYNPDQFEILGLAAGNIRGLAGIKSLNGKDGPYMDGKLKYGRIMIQHKPETEKEA
ncbi:adenine-specific methyltransferase EcoRI family protein [Corynebacterium sp. sy039]|uniref:adenine-specific methyltransferase EcoRI family protein n=1 Tax=Corynebacterium sp. sy039 TaxID=2599641 RepID=UPI0011B6FAEB|nr:adenine-specific methyltransferase EcoRI family protein [Corynebacterium sp. sy039]QDZ42441.1 DNA methyltransferase [Corynebacterium sp. sy039]